VFSTLPDFVVGSAEIRSPTGTAGAVAVLTPAIPEPGSLLLLGIGILGLLGYAWYRRQALA
jgi:hypothetical protein